MNRDEFIKLPPQNLDAERSVLGSMLLSKSAVVTCLETLKPECFYIPGHEVICQAIFTLHSKNNPVDILTVTDYLQSAGTLENVGGWTYLTDLLESVPTVAFTAEHAQLVRKKYLRRLLLNISAEIQEMAYDGEMEESRILEQVQEKIFNIDQLSTTTDFTHISEILSVEYEEASRAKEEGLTVDPALISTGITDLDYMLNGGLNPSDLIIIAARPGMGKSSLVMNLAVNVARNKKAVAISSLEMDKKQLGQRLISSEAEINLHYIKTRLIPDRFWQNYENKIVNLSELPIFIDDKSAVSYHELIAKLKRLKMKQKNLGCVIIDYLQIMDTEGDDDNREFAKITKALKRAAKDLDLPIILLSQLNRDLEKRKDKRPQLSDLRSSGAIEQDADICMFIYRDEYYNPETDKTRIAELIIAKHRNGPVGTVEVYFDGAFTKFTGLEK